MVPFSSCPRRRRGLERNLFLFLVLVFFSVFFSVSDGASASRRRRARVRARDRLQGPEGKIFVAFFLKILSVSFFFSLSLTTTIIIFFNNKKKIEPKNNQKFQKDYLDLFSLPYVPPSPRIAPGSGVFIKVSASSLVRLASQEKGAREAAREDTTTTTTTEAITTEGATATETPLLQPPRATPYNGKDRGVLLTLGTTQFGHLPLGLLDEKREKPAPKV